MINKICSVCGMPLNISQWRKNRQYKSCPRCSVINGKEHVYYKYPDNFGITKKRASSTNPDGPQSYCVPCRGDEESSETRYHCSEFDIE